MSPVKFNGQRLKEAREGKSPEWLAGAISRTRQTIHNWENGTCEPDASDLAMLAYYLGKPMEWFFEEEKTNVLGTDPKL